MPIPSVVLLRKSEERARLFKEALKEVHEEVAIDLVREMKSKAKKRRGATQASIRYEVLADGNVRIMAGGKLTTQPGGRGGLFDYVRAEEFGTVNNPANPFFFNTIRARKAMIRQKIIEHVTNKFGKPGTYSNGE